MSKATAKSHTAAQTNHSCTTAIAKRETSKFQRRGIVISENHISIEFLQSLLETFKVDSTINEDGDLRIAEAFGPVIYISLDPTRHWINFRTSFDIPSLDQNERTAFVNYISNNMAMAQFAPTDDGVGIGYYMYYRDGLIVSQFIQIAQRFGSLTCAVMRRYMTLEKQLYDQAKEQRQHSLN